MRPPTSSGEAGAGWPLVGGVAAAVVLATAGVTTVTLLRGAGGTGPDRLTAGT